MSNGIKNRPVLTSETPRPDVLDAFDVHPVAGLWPLLGESDLQEMARDIQEHGLQEHIWLHEKQILDGRNRLVACDMAAVEPEFQQWKPSSPAETPITFIMSKNLHRRHLSAGVRATVAVQIEEWIIEENARIKEEQAKVAANFSFEQPAPSTPTAPKAGTLAAPFGIGEAATTVSSRNGAGGRTRDQAAAAVGVSSGYVADAKDVRKASPEMFSRVAAGDITLPKAQEELVDLARQQGDLEALGIRPGARRAAEGRLDSRIAKKSPKPRIVVKKFGKLESSRVAVTIEAVFGSSQKAEDWLNRMQDEPSVLELNFEVKEAKAPKKKRAK